ncbi:MAG: hypothetical protein J6C28_00270 [Bacilli bacterium]|nr:hypothetical protein [Bacilli bacterium]
MARYTYNARLVQETIETLNEACKKLDHTNIDMKKGIDMIYNARGAENINIDFSPITGYQSQVIDFIDQMSGELRKKSKEIEEYENAPWYKKLFATIGMGALKIIEGFIGVNENVIDGLVSIVGFIGGLFSSRFQDCLGEFIKKDWVGDTTAKWYEEGWLKNVNKYSYMSHQSTAANVLKGVGNAVGYIALSCIPYVGFAVSTAAATMGAIGSGTQSGLQQGMSYNQAFGQGAKQGAVALATSLITKGIANKLTSGAGAVTNSIDDVSRAASSAKNTFTGLKSALAGAGDDIAGLLDDAAGALDDVANFADDAVIAGGATTQSANAAFNSAKNLTSTLDKLKTAAQAAGYGDDVLNSIDEMAAAAKSTQTAANAAKNIVANTSTITNGKFGETVKNIGNKIPGSKAVASAVGKVTSNPVVQKAVTGLSNAAQAAAKASPVVSSAVSTTAGVVASGTLGDNQTSTAYRQFVQESQTTTPGMALYNETQQTLQNAKPSAATAEQAAQNLQNMEAQGYVPGSSSTTEIPVTTPVATPVPTAGSSSSSPTYNVTTKPVDIAPYPNENEPTNYQPTITTKPVVIPENTPSTEQPVLDDVINNIIIDNDQQPPTGINTTTGTTTNEVIGHTVQTSSQVLNTFGNVSNSVSTMDTKTMIPTSSSPILSSATKESSSFAPLGAGISTAALAGFGTKKLVDKKKEEKEDKLNVEQWQQNDNTEDVTFSHELLKDADYLNPMDELAFQE